MHKLTLAIRKFLNIFIICCLLISCNTAKEILREAHKDDQKEQRKEQKENKPNNPNPTSNKKEPKKIKDVPLSGKIDPDGLPVSNSEAIKKLEESTFPKFFNIDNDITVRHRNLSVKQIETLIQLIKEAKAEFFDIFGLEKNEENATEDFTNGVIIDVFDTDALYKEMFPKLFDATAYDNPEFNAGMCFENNPAFKGNLCRIALKIFTDIEGFEISNVKHEFTHYLDMRYNWSGVGYEPNDWWMEGLAEYLGNPQDEKEHIKTVKKHRYTLKSIMSSDNADNSNEKAADKKYSGGSLAIKFMFENHVDEINKFLDIIRNGEYEVKYDKWRKSFINKYNIEFSKWVVKLK